MKKTVILIGICAILIAMPIFSATPIKTNVSWLSKTIKVPTDAEYDGTFIGAIGHLYKENDEWVFNASAYLAGVYKLTNFKIIYGNIYNLDEEQIGNITMIASKFFLIGRIQDMEGHKAPIVGFLFTNEQYFVGRIMSFFGPAPHIWGQYTPN